MKFYVGQRVKKVRGPFAGVLTGVVAEIDPHDDRSLGVRTDVSVLGWDCDGARVPCSAGQVCFGYQSEFEPIYDGHQPVSWESCLWQPSPQEANA